SRRDAFKSINVPPIAKVTPKKIEYLSEYRKASVGPIRLTGGFHENVGLVFYYPGLKADILSKLYDIFDGIVIAGTGLGHVHEDLIPIIKRATDEGKPTVITTQCLYGRVNLFVYSTGRRLLKAGVIPGEDMLPEVAYVKLMWVMNKTRDLEKIRELMLMNFRGEISERRVAHELP
ncbi:MAG: Glu-tRNA(Gln) amidotransferase GatDE subunit D, partial [Thermoplasmata archaeon]